MEDLLILLLLLGTPVYADARNSDDYFLKVGVNANTSELVKNKFVSLGMQKPAFYLFDYQLEAGYLYENGMGAAFAGPSLGLSVNNNGYYTKVFAGPELVSSTDAHISTPYEFNLDVELGLRDKAGVGVGLGYKHMSNAGLCDKCANLGLDFFYVKVQIP